MPRRGAVGAARRREAGTNYVENFASGVNGDAWPGWVTISGTVDKQAGKGRMQTGAVAYATAAARYNVPLPQDYEVTANATITTVTAAEFYGAINVRGNTTVFSDMRNHASWHLRFTGTIAVAIGELYRIDSSGAQTFLATGTGAGFVQGSVLRVRVNVTGNRFRARYWKNAEAEPSTWQIDYTDVSAPVGPNLSVAVRAGNNASFDRWDWDDIVIVGAGGAAPPSSVTGTVSRALGAVVASAAGSGTAPSGLQTVRIGATWTGVRPAASMNSTVAVHDTQAVHIIDFGPAGGNLNPSPGVYNWGPLDASIQQVMDAGPTKPIIILCRCPPWMRPQPPPPDPLSQAFFSWEDSSPQPQHRTNWANLCAAVAARYTQVAYFSYWNEMKGYHIPHRTNEAASFAVYESQYGTVAVGDIGNHWDYVRYTTDYNAIWNAVKAVRPTCKIGGPYVILQSGEGSAAWSHGPSALTFPGGSHDQRQLDVMTYFVANAVGYDFLSCDGGFGNNRQGAAVPANPNLQIQKLWGWWVWVRGLGGAAATCELFNFETYLQEALDAPWSFTLAQTEDLWIEMCRQTALNVPNPTVSYLTWFHPLFLPQVVNRVNTNVWANTTSTFHPKVQAWHGTSPTFLDPLTLFRTTYPAAGAEIWVDPAGNDANPGTTGSPKRTVQAAINVAVAGSQIRVRAGTYNDGPFSWSGKNGTQASWIQLRLEPGAVMQLAGGGFGQGLSQLQNCSFIAIYGGEWVGVNNVSNPYEVAHLAQNGAHSWAVWGGNYHDSGGHAVALINAPGRFDVCYNRMSKLCRWNEFQASAISCIGMTNGGTAWPDGYHIREIGNVIDATWTDPTRVPPWDPGGVFIPSDGNGIIWDVSAGFTNRSLAAKNLIVGCGGRALHALDVDNVDMYLNTTLDNSQNLAGSWIGEISITDSNGCRAAWNLCAARTGSNRVGIFQNPGTSTWSDTVFLRGTGGSEANDPSVAAFGNVNLTATGPTNYFVAYQPGVHQQISITNVAGFRPKLATVSKFTPSAALRTLLSGWPDPLGYLPPATGNWAYGAFEAA